MAMGGGGSTYRSADGIWHAAMDNVYLHADTEALLKASEGATGALRLTD